MGHGMQGWARKAKEQQKAFSATPRRDQARSSEHDAANRHRRRATVYKGAPASQRTWASGRTRDAPGAKSLCLLRRCLLATGTRTRAHLPCHRRVQTRRPRWHLPEGIPCASETTCITSSYPPLHNVGRSLASLVN